MRLLAAVLLVVLASVVLFGIVYVPRHDGDASDLLLVVLLPTAGVCWCIDQLLPRPRTTDESRDGSGKNTASSAPSPKV